MILNLCVRHEWHDLKKDFTEIYPDKIRRKVGSGTV